MLDMIHGTVAEQIVKLGQILKQRREEMDERRENNREKEEMLNRIENHLLCKTTKGPSDTTGAPLQVEEELVVKGMSRGKVREQLLLIAKALLQEPGTITERLAPVSTFERPISKPFLAPVQSPSTLLVLKNRLAQKIFVSYVWRFKRR